MRMDGPALVHGTVRCGALPRALRTPKAATATHTVEPPKAGSLCSHKRKGGKRNTKNKGRSGLRPTTKPDAHGSLFGSRGQRGPACRADTTSRGSVVHARRSLPGSRAPRGPARHAEPTGRGSAVHERQKPGGRCTPSGLRTTGCAGPSYGRGGAVHELPVPRRKKDNRQRRRRPTGQRLTSRASRAAPTQNLWWWPYLHVATPWSQTCGGGVVCPPLHNGGSPAEMLGCPLPWWSGRRYRVSTRGASSCTDQGPPRTACGPDLPGLSAATAPPCAGEQAPGGARGEATAIAPAHPLVSRMS